MKSLAEIGQELRAKAEVEGTAYRGLRSGLHLHLSTSGGIYMLLLWRSDSLPSELEIETVMRDWRLPLNAEISTPSTLVWVNDRRLDDSICRIVTWGGPQVVDDEPSSSDDAASTDRSHLRARPTPHLYRCRGVVGEPIRHSPTRYACQLRNDDPWWDTPTGRRVRREIQQEFEV